MSSAINPAPKKADNSRKKTSSWRWFIGMYIASLAVLGSFHGLSHLFTAWLNRF